MESTKADTLVSSMTFSSSDWLRMSSQRLHSTSVSRLLYNPLSFPIPALGMRILRLISESLLQKFHKWKGPRNLIMRIYGYALMFQMNYQFYGQIGWMQRRYA